MYTAWNVSMIYQLIKLGAALIWNECKFLEGKCYMLKIDNFQVKVLEIVFLIR